MERVPGQEIRTGKDAGVLIIETFVGAIFQQAAAAPPSRMSVFEDYRFSPAEFSGVVRLFPLPNLVMFPHVMQPLHVFEPRYRDLLADAMRHDRLIAMAVLSSGWEADYDGRPPIGPHACLGRVVVSRPLDDGTHNLLLAGLRRVRLLNELPPQRAYREATARVCEDIYPANERDQCQSLKRELHGRLSRLLPQLPQIREQLEHLLHSAVSLGVLTDVLGYALDLALSDKRALLSEPNVDRRAELLLGHLAAAVEDCDHRERVISRFPPEFSRN
jgi:ATP-dependent Lon protease